MIGVVVAISYGVYSVDVDGVIYHTSPRGLFKHGKGKILVGDKVLLDDENYLILEVLPRHNSLKRPPLANVDEIMLVFSLNEPSFSYYLAFKYLTYANYLGIKASLVLTKIDMSNDFDVDEIVDIYHRCNIDVYLVSNSTKEGIEDFKKALQNKVVCFMGQTGVGKSSLLNSINPEFDRDIGSYSIALGRGKHQTKEVILLPHENSYLADTPGFSSLELDLLEEEVATYFPLIREYHGKCFYNNCMHVHEPKCLVKKALEEGSIPSIIYKSYLKLLEEIKELNHG